MKRSFEDTLGVHYSTDSVSDSSSSDDNSSSGSSSLDSNTDECVHENKSRKVDSFVPNNFEKQVISKAIASICRSNMSDWNLDSEYEGEDYMILRELAYINNQSIDIVIEVTYTPNVTFCSINYGNETENNVMCMHWDTSVNSSNTITICKDVTETYFFIFSFTALRKLHITAEDNRDRSWCYFMDARRHLNRIRPQYV